LENAHLQKEAAQKQSTHIPMQKVEGDALHMDNIHTQRERTRKLHMRPTLKEAKQRQMGNIHMQKETQPNLMGYIVTQRD
jgi:hypothetical protein